MTLGLIHPILEAPREAAAMPDGPEEPAPVPEPLSEEEDSSSTLSPLEATLAPFPTEDESVRGREGLPGEPDSDPGEDSTAIFPTAPDPGGQENSPDLGEPEVGEAEPERGASGSFSGVSVDDETDTPLLPPVVPTVRPQRDPVVNLPLFALTAPEDPALDAPLDEAPAPDSPLPGTGGRGARFWAIAGIAAAILIAGILFVRRPRVGTSAAPPPASAPVSPPSPPSPSKAQAPARPAGEERWAQLAEAGRREMEHPGTHRYAIQLELACESSTLEKAFAADPGRRHIWIAPYAFRNRHCYRVLWGKFGDLASARGAKGAVPPVFALDGNRPTVVALGPPAGGKRKR